VALFLFQLLFKIRLWRWNEMSEQETTRRKGIGQGRGERRQYTNRRGSSGHVSPAIVEKYLAGMHYPAEKQKLISNAQNKEAPSDVLDLINKLPDKTYKSPIDITKEIGKIE
jgi:hypothetical protein